MFAETAKTSIKIERKNPNLSPSLGTARIVGGIIGNSLRSLFAQIRSTNFTVKSGFEPRRADNENSSLHLPSLN